MMMFTTKGAASPETHTFPFKKKLIATAITLTIGTATSTASAGLSSGNTLHFVLGTPQVVSCKYGTTPPCSKDSYNVTDIVGSYFVMDTNGNNVPEPQEKTPIESFNGIVIGTAQLAGGSHAGPIDGTESPNIDKPWTFFGNTGMHQTTTPVTVDSDLGNIQHMDMAGWNVTWNALPSVPLNQLGNATVVCDTSCSLGENYTLDGTFHVVGAGFTTVPYFLHLEGTVEPEGSTPPLPPPTRNVSIQLPGGSPFECSAHGGSTLEVTADILTTDTDDIASVSWLLDGEVAGTGVTISIFTPLGAHTLEVIVDTLTSGTFQDSEPVTVRDRTAPELGIRFIDKRSGAEITEVNGNGRHKVTVRYDAVDTCDPEPTTSGVAVPVHAIDDGDVIKIIKKKFSTTRLGTSAINVSAEAVDTSGNRRARAAQLLISD